MSTRTIDVHEAQLNWTELLSQLATGMEIILTQDDKPVARMLPITHAAQRISGLHSGAIWTSDDFDAPLPEFH